MTKRKRTTIAPAYTISWIAARNCACSARKSPAIERIMRSRPIALRMGFLKVIVYGFFPSMSARADSWWIDQTSMCGAGDAFTSQIASIT
jgi:hypothetical protein